ncbi:MAG: hypothetical protein V7717_05360 [Porticoccaceae bacterium]
MLGDFPKAMDDTILDSNAAQQNQALQRLSDPAKARAFSQIVFDLLSRGCAAVRLLLRRAHYHHLPAAGEMRDAGNEYAYSSATPEFKG